MIFPSTLVIHDLILQLPTIQFANDLCSLVQKNQKEFKYIPATQELNTPEKSRNALKQMIEKQTNNNYTYLLFTNNTLIGAVGLKIRPAGFVAEISYYLDKNYTGNGYISKAITKLENIFFEQGGHRTEIFCNEANTASCNVAKRLNYKLDGIMREYEYIDGKFHGVAIYSKITIESF